MSASRASEASSSLRDCPRSGVARSARLLVAFSAAGGVVSGGFLVGVTALDAPQMARALLPLTPHLFVIGAAGGALHGCVLAVLGRDAETSSVCAARGVLMGILLAIPALAVAWVATAWISLTSAVIALPSWSRGFLVLLAWAIGAGACSWAAVDGWQAARSAFARWPESRPGALLVVGIGIILAVSLPGWRPQFLGIESRITGVGSVILSQILTLWVALPLVVVLLHYLHRRFAPLWDRAASADHAIQNPH